MYLSVMLNNRNSISMDIIYDVLNHDVIAHLKEANFNNSTIPNEIIAKFYIGSVFNIGIEWIKKDTNYTKEELVNYLEKLIPDIKEKI